MQYHDIINGKIVKVALKKKSSPNYEINKNGYDNIKVINQSIKDHEMATHKLKTTKENLERFSYLCYGFTIKLGRFSPAAWDEFVSNNKIKKVKSVETYAGHFNGMESDVKEFEYWIDQDKAKYLTYYFRSPGREAVYSAYKKDLEEINK